MDLAQFSHYEGSVTASLLVSIGFRTSGNKLPPRDRARRVKVPRSPGAIARAIGIGLAALTVMLSASAAQAQQEERVEWSKSWPRIRVWEAANILVLSVGSGIIHSTPVAEEARWSTPILFDKPLRNLLKSNDREVQRQAALISDFFYRGVVLAPYVIDNYIVAMGVHESADVALEMTLINLQALGMAGVFSLGAEHAIGRSRPYVRDCGPEKKGPDKVGFNTCGGIADNQAFPSGHTAAAFTMAALTCVHHQHLPLYGGGVPDALACATMTAAATTTGILRLVSDRHWATDVLAGAAVGIVSGYILPSWLHYGFGKSKPKESSAIFKTSYGYVAPYPQVYPGGAGVGLSGAF